MQVDRNGRGAHEFLTVGIDDDGDDLMTSAIEIPEPDLGSFAGNTLQAPVQQDTKMVPGAGAQTWPGPHADSDIAAVVAQCLFVLRGQDLDRSVGCRRGLRCLGRDLGGNPHQDQKQGAHDRKIVKGIRGGNHATRGGRRNVRAPA